MAHPGEIGLVEVTTPQAMEQAWSIRRRVFIEEQGVPEAIEMDEDDAHAVHVLALDGDDPVGCGRLVIHAGQAKIGRMAVLRERRGAGIGASVLSWLNEAARARGFVETVLHAQLHAEGFYLKNGYSPQGEVFDEAGIPHRRMSRRLIEAN